MLDKVYATETVAVAPVLSFTLTDMVLLPAIALVVAQFQVLEVP